MRVKFRAHGDELLRLKNGSLREIVREVEQYEPNFRILEQMNYKIALGHKKHIIEIPDADVHELIKEIHYKDGFAIIKW